MGGGVAVLIKQSTTAVIWEDVEGDCLIRLYGSNLGIAKGRSLLWGCTIDLPIVSKY